MLSVRSSHSFHLHPNAAKKLVQSMKDAKAEGHRLREEEERRKELEMKMKIRNEKIARKKKQDESTARLTQLGRKPPVQKVG